MNHCVGKQGQEIGFSLWSCLLRQDRLAVKHHWRASLCCLNQHHKQIILMATPRSQSQTMIFFFTSLSSFSLSLPINLETNLISPVPLSRVTQCSYREVRMGRGFFLTFTVFNSDFSLLFIFLAAPLLALSGCSQRKDNQGKNSVSCALCTGGVLCSGILCGAANATGSQIAQLCCLWALATPTACTVNAM